MVMRASQRGGRLHREERIEKTACCHCEKRVSNEAIQKKLGLRLVGPTHEKHLHSIQIAE